MSSFEIRAEITTSPFIRETKKEIVYFTRDGKNYNDSVIFNKNTISILGSRKKIKNSERILETSNSTHYNSLIKALLFTYFSTRSFSINKIEVFANGKLLKLYKEDDIVQTFSEHKLIDINCSSLFEEKIVSDVTMKALMNLTMSFKYKNLKFDYAWKCFNLLLRYVFRTNKDFDMLRLLRGDIETEKFLYKNILNFADDNITVDYIKSCYINKMICNNFPKGKTKNLPEFLNSFDDYRVNEALVDKMKCKKNDLQSLNQYNTIQQTLLNKIEKGTKKNTDLVRLIILRYAYYLRCKYFHAEKMPANFIVNNANQNELDRISIPLIIICKDLIENKIRIT